MILIFALGILAYIIPPDTLITNPAFKTRTELFLTMTIGMFVVLEGYSTVLQLYDNRKRNIIVDLGNELEKVYSPLFTLLKDFTEWVEVNAAYVTSNCSMEQLWLAFVMQEKYKKTWDGEKWIKTLDKKLKCVNINV